MDIAFPFPNRTVAIPSCPPAIVAARAALSQTAFAKNLRPQSLLAKVLVIESMGMASNGYVESTPKYSRYLRSLLCMQRDLGSCDDAALAAFVTTEPQRFRKSVLMPKSAMAFTIAASVLGQVIGFRAERYSVKAVASKTLPLTTETSVG
ncbi:hypothetical protein DVH24_022115 [Malus domestica]|uniref:Uncharacterized protein n=1 Tax=Malus domestica TaxID=3750 RepID=A0A498IYQ6_MALDO|nr:hypothetical protein DVH24_022115 [Malus domestica]